MPKTDWQHRTEVRADDTWVHDSRNGNVQGPFGRDAARKMTEDLNEMVLRNTQPLLFAMSTTDSRARIEGPFYLSSEARRLVRIP